MPMRARPSASTAADFTMPSSVIGRRISGSMTVESAAVSCSVVGVVMMLPRLRRLQGGDGLSDGQRPAGVVDVQVLDHPSVDGHHAATVALGLVEGLDDPTRVLDL